MRFERTRRTTEYSPTELLCRAGPVSAVSFAVFSDETTAADRTQTYDAYLRVISIWNRGGVKLYRAQYIYIYIRIYVYASHSVIVIIVAQYPLRSAPSPFVSSPGPNVIAIIIIRRRCRNGRFPTVRIRRACACNVRIMRVYSTRGMTHRRARDVSYGFTSSSCFAVSCP